MEHVDTAGGQGLVGMVRGGRLGHAPHPVQYSGQIDAGRLDLDPELRGLANPLRSRAACTRPLLGTQAGNQAFSPGARLSIRATLAPTRGQNGRVQTSRASTDHHKVIHSRCLEVCTRVNKFAGMAGMY